MKKHFLNFLGCILLLGTLTFAGQRPSKIISSQKLSFSDTIPHKSNMKKNGKNKMKSDSTKNTGMYNSDNTADTGISRTSTGDYNNQPSSGNDTTKSAPPKF